MEGKGIIFLQKDKFDFYSTGLTKIIEFRFIPEIVRDLEIVNSNLLENLIKLFVSNNKIVPMELIIVLADNACFIKDFVPPTAASGPQQQNVNQSAPITPQNNEASKKMQEDIDFFIEHVPFENVQSRNFPVGNGTKVLAVNRDFYEAIRKAFEKMGFGVREVYPGMVFENNIGAKPAMDIITANAILQQVYNVKGNNLLKESKIFQPVVENKIEDVNNFVVKEMDNKPGVKSNKRLFIMIGIFVILIIILIIVYLGSLQ